MDNRPLGVFDSGVGGLTVVRAMEESLSSENIIYLGDTARVPYGTKSPETVVRYSREISKFLLSHDVKKIVIACNTASSCALLPLQAELGIPVIGVIEPGVEAALAATRNGRIGIIGTPGTVNSGAYQKALQERRQELTIIAEPTPLLVPLIEEDWLEHEATRVVLEEYLKPFRLAEVDTLVLACTHYPLLKPQLARMMGPEVALVDSATTCSWHIKRSLKAEGTIRDTTEEGKTQIYLTDLPGRFAGLAERFLKRKPGPIQRISVDN